AGWTVGPKVLYQRSPFGPDHKMARAFYSGLRDFGGGGPVLDFDEATVQTAEQWLADGPAEPWVLFVALLFPHPPFEVEQPWFSLHDRDAMPSPSPPSFEGKPRYMRAIHGRYGLDRLDGHDWAEIAAT